MPTPRQRQNGCPNGRRRLVYAVFDNLSAFWQQFLCEFELNIGPDLFTSGLFLRLKLGLPVGLAGAKGPDQLTQLVTPMLTSKIGLGDESGPDIR
jgi:hypothetical protein